MGGGGAMQSARVGVSALAAKDVFEKPLNNWAIIQGALHKSIGVGEGVTLCGCLPVGSGVPQGFYMTAQGRPALRFHHCCDVLLTVGWKPARGWSQRMATQLNPCHDT